MPLLDHFHPPLSMQRHWQAFHSAWAGNVTHQLNQDLLPPRYFAEPNVQLGGQVEIDVGTFKEAAGAHAGSSGAATAVWAPPRPSIRAPIDFANLDVFEVQIPNDEQGPRLVAAIELISPANKDPTSHREAFRTECASYLQQGVSLVLVDIVTTRQGNLHQELLELLRVAWETVPEPPSHLYAVAYRTVAHAGQVELEAWPEPLRLGAALPTLPLWIEADMSLPLDLEHTYAATCESLRIGP